MQNVQNAMQNVSSAMQNVSGFDNMSGVYNLYMHKIFIRINIICMYKNNIYMPIYRLFNNINRLQIPTIPIGIVGIKII